jgi:hypothetical protein
MWMNDFDNYLTEEKKRLDQLKAPDELETRLRNALDTTPYKRKKTIWKLAVVALFFMMVVSYHYNGLSFYSKKLLGFDEVITGTLKELNDDGMGQIVEKKTTLADGTEFIINGIMTDANQLILYFTLTNPDGLTEPYDTIHLSRITGFLTNSPVIGGTFLTNDAGTELKGSMFFEPVSPFSKELTVHFRQQTSGGQMTEETVSFKYDPNQAMQTEIKQSIKKTANVDQGTVSFDSITATPTLTVIEGALKVENFDRVHFALGGIELIANEKPIDLMGGGVKSSLFRGQKFGIRFDALPKPLHSLKIVIKDFVGYQTLERKIPLTSDKSIQLNGKELWIKDVSTTSQGIEITIATEDDVMLDGVSIETQNEQTPLKTTINQTVTPGKDGQMLKERTLLFDSELEPEFLLLEGMHYMKPYHTVIEIPVD